MTRRLSFVAGLLLACSCLWAQSWTKPAAPAAMPLTEGAECYLYNVGAEGFYLGAYDWTTRASVHPTRGYKVFIDRYETEDIRWDGQSYFITSYIEEGSKTGQTLCLFLDGENSIWVDREKKDDVDRAFTFESNEDGTFRIGLSPLNAKYNAEMFPNYFLSIMPIYGERRIYLATTSDYADAQQTWQFVSPENYRAYVAAVEQWQAAVVLGEALEDAEKRFAEVDLSGVKAVYADAASTAEQLKAAHLLLMTILQDYASPSKPVAVTSAITNPSYDNNDNTGWEGTAPGFQFFCNAEFFNRNFSASQTVKNLRPGVYVVGVKGFYRAGGAIEDAAERQTLENGEVAQQNAKLFASTAVISNVAAPLPLASMGATDEPIGNNTESTPFGYIPNDMQTAAMYVGAGKYPPTQVTTYTADGSIQIGLTKDVLIGNDWTLFDEWELFYLGASDEALQYLKNSRKEVYPDYVEMIEMDNDVYYGRQAYETYKRAAEALDKASTADEIVSAITVFESAVNAFAENLAAYKDYSIAYEEACEFLETHQADLMGDGVEILEDYLWDEKGPREGFPHPNGGAVYILDNGTLSTQEVMAEMAYLKKLQEDALTAGMVDGMDCTSLIKNPHFNSADGWTKEGLPEYPAGTDTYKVGEAYSILFGVSQEITGLQNGLYELQLNGFFRPANYGSTDYTENYRAYAFMNDFQKKLTFIEDGATEEAVDGHSYQIASGYVPNSVEEAATSFQAGHYKQSVYGLVTDGIMRIGVRNDLRYEGCWAVWSDFKLTFRAKNPDVLAEVIGNTLPTAREMIDSKCGTEELSALQAAIGAAEMAGDEERYDAMVALKGAMDDVTACTALYATLATAIDNLEDAIKEYPNAKSIEEAKALYKEVVDAYDKGSYTATQAEDKIEEIGTMVVSVKLGDSAGEEEQDFSELIVNRNFDPAKGSKDEGRIDGWTTTAMNGYKEYTVSYNRAGFELYQDLTGLPKGKYKVTVHTYYRAGYWNEEEEHIKNGEETHLTTLYAQTSADRAEKPVLNLTEGATTEIYYDGKAYTLSSGLFAPDGTSATAAWFAAGAYLNELEFTVPEDGKVRIGLSKKDVYQNDYQVVGEWCLYYYGDPDVETREDYTSLIVNPTFDPAKGSKDEGRIDGWTTTAMNGYKEYTVSYNRAGFELFQDLSGLPEGNYEVTVHTYYRAGYWNEEEDHIRNGEETHLTTLYAETSNGRAEKPVMNLTEGATSEIYYDGKAYTLSSGLFAPDGTSATAAWFAAGAYLNNLEFTVPSDGKVRIGLSKKEVFPNDYQVVGAWNLYYLGKATTIDGVPSGESVTAMPVGFYTLSGARVAQPQRGINIVRMPDGTVRKVLLK